MAEDSATPVQPYERTQMNKKTFEGHACHGVSRACRQRAQAKGQEKANEVGDNKLRHMPVKAKVSPTSHGQESAQPQPHGASPWESPLEDSEEDQPSMPKQPVAMMLRCSQPTQKDQKNRLGSGGLAIVRLKRGCGEGAKVLALAPLPHRHILLTHACVSVHECGQRVSWRLRSVI